MEAAERRSMMLQRLAWACLALLVAVTVLSAFLRHQALPAEAGAVVAAARLAHRITATLALPLIVALVALGLRMPRSEHRPLALSIGLLALALALALLGVFTAGARAPAVAMGNLLGGYAMLALAARLVAPAAGGGIGAPAIAVGLVLLLQIVAGALLSTSHAGRACSDLAECGALVRNAGWDWHALNPWAEPLAPSVVPQPEGAPAQLLHRLFSFVAAPLLAWLAVAAIRRGRRREGIALLALLAAQLALGLVIGSTGLPLSLVLLHNLASALLLALVLRLL